MKKKRITKEKLQIFLSIVFTNLIPFLGVLFFGWNIYNLMYIFYFESFLAGVFNVLRMAVAKGKNAEMYKDYKRVSLILFFCTHYFVFMLPGIALVFLKFVLPEFHNEDATFCFGWVMLGLFITYSLSFISDFILTGKYEQIAPSSLFWTPYTRLLIMAVLIFVSFMLRSLSGQPQPFFFLLLFVISKFTIDLLSMIIPGVPWDLSLQKKQ